MRAVNVFLACALASVALLAPAAPEEQKVTVPKEAVLV